MAEQVTPAELAAEWIKSATREAAKLAAEAESLARIAGRLQQEIEQGQLAPAINAAQSITRNELATIGHRCTELTKQLAYAVAYADAAQ